MSEPDPAVYYDLGDGLTVTGDGEIVELPPGVPDAGRVAYLASRRDGAKDQEQAWEQTRRAIDRAILALPEIAGLGAGAKVTAGDRVLSVRSKVDLRLDVAAFLAEIEHAELTADALRAILAAATGFDVSRLPPEWAGMARLFTREAESVRWVQTAPILKANTATKRAV